ncbi:hypothetical protein PIB30_016208 [Stylosanthes scabra]|uniref:Uncharacterized protein n=1 Tax=Stylosanthes scabra TaxID=79078 RepID=A0ABU6V9K6_9FABA|nr:hypothetical protein [Stylosanthes scabra]
MKRSVVGGVAVVVVWIILRFADLALPIFSHITKELHKAEMKCLEEGRAARIAASVPVPPPIDENDVWDMVIGCRGGVQARDRSLATAMHGGSSSSSTTVLPSFLMPPPPPPPPPPPVPGPPQPPHAASAPRPTYTQQDESHVDDEDYI